MLQMGLSVVLMARANSAVERFMVDMYRWKQNRRNTKGPLTDASRKVTTTSFCSYHVAST